MSTQGEPKPLLTLTCACGRISVSSTAVPVETTFCHCVSCQKISGSGFQAFAHVPASSLHWVDRRESKPVSIRTPEDDEHGPIKTVSLSEIGQRWFCQDCCSTLAMRYLHQPDAVGLAVGAVDKDSIATEEVEEALKPEKHIFMEQNPWWCVVDDDLPKYARFRGSFETEMDDWVASKAQR